MYSTPNILIIGAAGRNVGKTEFACELIKRHAIKESVIAVKITTIQERDGKCPRGGEGCGVCSSLQGDFCITEEKGGPEGKDTVRMQNSGADQVFWLRVLDDKLEEGVAALLNRIPDNACVICESNSARRVIEPGIFLVVKENGNNAIKGSCAKVINDADHVISFFGDSWSMSPSELIFRDGQWQVSEPVSAIVLAGGQSQRMGENKSLIPIDGVPLIQLVVGQLHTHFANCLISSNDGESMAFLGLPIVPDLKPDSGPLMGIMSCLKQSPTDLNLVVACDMPQLDYALIGKLLANAEGADIVMPALPDGKYEPLFALYRKSVIPHAEQLLASGKRRIVALFDSVNVKFIQLEDEQACLNLNTRDDLNTWRNQLKPEK